MYLLSQLPSSAFFFSEYLYQAVFTYFGYEIFEDNHYIYILNDLLFLDVQNIYFIQSVLNPYLYILTGRKLREEGSRLKMTMCHTTHFDMRICLKQTTKTDFDWGTSTHIRIILYFNKKIYKLSSQRNEYLI